MDHHLELRKLLEQQNPAAYQDAHKKVLYDQAGQPLQREGINAYVQDFLNTSGFQPLFTEAVLSEVPDFRIDAPEDGVQRDYRETYARQITHPEKPHAGATAGLAQIDGHDVVVFASHWLAGGSVGEVEGELLTQAFLTAAEKDVPMIALTASGGMKQEEGPKALLQMPRTATAMELFKQVTGKPFVSVAVGPMLGGTTASTGLNGDITISVGERQTVAFTGEKVIKYVMTYIEQNPAGLVTPFDQSALVNMLEGNGIDFIAQPDELMPLLARILNIVEPQKPEEHAADHEPHGLRRRAQHVGAAIMHSAIAQRALHKGTTKTLPLKGNGLRSVLDHPFEDHVAGHARHNRYPMSVKAEKTGSKEVADPIRWRVNHESHVSRRALDHIDSVTVLQYGFDDFVLRRNPYEYNRRLHFDNVITAFARIGDSSVMVIGQQPDYEVSGNGKDAELLRRFSQPTPKDWVRVQEAVEVANRLRLPVVSLLDSPGAASSKQADLGGQGFEMGKALAKLCGSETPVLTYVIGAAGSGGAICQASLFPQPRALDTATIFVADPNAAAAIIKPQDSPSPHPSIPYVNQMADAMKLGADAWVSRSNVFRDVIRTHPDPRDTTLELKTAITEDLRRFGSLSPAELRAGRLGALVSTAQNVRLVWVE